MNNQRKISKNLFIFAFFTVMTITTWALFDAYRAWNKKEIPVVLQQQIETLNPILNVETLNSLINRIPAEK